MKGVSDITQAVVGLHDRIVALESALAAKTEEVRQIKEQYAALERASMRREKASRVALDKARGRSREYRDKAIQYSRDLVTLRLELKRTSWLDT